MCPGTTKRNRELIEVQFLIVLVIPTVAAEGASNCRVGLSTQINKLESDTQPPHPKIPCIAIQAKALCNMWP